jgi:hypothetical protein
MNYVLAVYTRSYELTGGILLTWWTVRAGLQRTANTNCTDEGNRR